MSRDRYERRHRLTAAEKIEAVEMMAKADFDAVPSLSEAMGLEGEAMETTQIWFVEDTDGTNHGYGVTQRDAEAYVSGNRGYDDYDGSRFRECLADGLAKEAVLIEVLKPVADTLLATCKI